MTEPDPGIELGAITIWLPTAGEARCSILEDLTERLGVETNQEAMERLRAAWRDRGHRGRLDLDCEADAVSVHAGRDAIVDAVALIDALSVAPQLDAAEVVRVRAIVKAHRRPPKVAWEVGDVFAIPLGDGSYGFGQVLYEEVSSPTCALFEHRASSTAIDLDEALTSRTLTILNEQSKELDEGAWIVIGRRDLAADPFGGVHGRPGSVGSTSGSCLAPLARAWHRTGPWNPYFDED